MEAIEAVKTICSEANWIFKEEDFLKTHSLTIALTDYTLCFHDYQDTLLLSVDLIVLPQDEVERNDLLHKVGNLVSSVWQDHTIFMTCSDKYVKVELRLLLDGLTKDKLLDTCTEFLDDCDYFYENLASVKQDFSGAMFGVIA